MNVCRSSLPLVLILSGLWICFFFPGCGRKDLPVPPRQLNPPAVIDLQHKVQDGQVELSWTVPKKKSRHQTDLAGFKVYRSKITLSEADCDNCPLNFSMIRDIVLLKRDQKEPLVFSDPLDPGYRYTYVVRGYSDNGMVSADSNVVNFNYE